MRTPSEMLGLMAYLFVMYGGTPDREILSAVYRGDLEEQENAPKLTVIRGGNATRPAASPRRPSRAA